MLVLFAVCAVYSAILAVFIARGYPSAGVSVLGVPVERQYALQIWYQAPLFVATTAVTAGLLVLVARIAGNAMRYSVAFGRVALASAVPFACTMMLVEFSIAILMALGVIDPLSTLRWLTGSGVWFASLYQLAGIIWLVALVFIAVRVSLSGHRWISAMASLLLIMLYAAPVALLIR